MSSSHVIELSIPGRLQFCDMARRVVMESCKLLGRDRDTTGYLSINSGDGGGADRADDGGPAGVLSESYQFEDQFTIEFISAFSEIYNNIALHAYAGDHAGLIALTIVIASDHLVVEISDTGRGFDIDAVPPPDELPIGGMGIYLARAMLDRLEYQPGPPNRWRLIKYVPQALSKESAAAMD